MIDGYGETQSLTKISPQPIPLLERLKRERDDFQKKLNEYNEAISALENNPEFEKMLNVLGKVSRI